MSAESALLEAYAAWRGLSVVEGEAIRSQNWSRVAECQDTLRQLQPRIIGLTDEAHTEWLNAGVDRKLKEQSLRSVVGELIEQEKRNSTLLTSMRERLQAQLGELDHTSRNLKKLHRSYVPARPSAWTSFS